jgi:spoIIIJ-associated protein
MQSIEIEAKTTKEAITVACEKLSTTPEQLKIDVIEQGPGVLMSLFSSKKTKFRATRISAPLSENDTDAIEQIETVLKHIVTRIQDEATVTMEHRDDEIFFTINGDGSGIFIGKHGQTLEAIQFMLNKIRLSKFRSLPHIQVDCESYRVRHFENMVELANRMSEKAKKHGAPVTTNPLSPGDRRIIHMTLKKDAELTTWSKGSGTLKKVIIAPRQSKQS